MSQHFRMSPELSGAIVKRLPHAKKRFLCLAVICIYMCILDQGLLSILKYTLIIYTLYMIN